MNPTWDIITGVVHNEPEQTKPARATGEGFSQFVTRILDQLSLSSWLPAIMLICNIALILQLRSQHNLDLGHAITALTAKPLGLLIILLLSIVVVSIVTQAFEFEAIRLLEGYWGRIMLIGFLSGLRTKRHGDRLTHLKRQYDKYHFTAFSEARERMLDNHVPRDLVDILDKQRRDEPLDGHDPDRITAAEQLGWQRFAAPELLHKMSATESRIMEYPLPHRILPTKLGNTLRASEDRLRLGAGEELEEFVYRRYDLMTTELKFEHDQYRSRLNIYCLLTFVFCSLTIVSLFALDPRADPAGVAAFAIVYMILALISYQAAIVSARGYVTVLRVINDQSISSSKD